MEYTHDSSYTELPPEAYESTSGLIPPQAADVERSVLGAMLIDEKAVAQVIEVLPEPDAFFLPKHRKIYGAVCELFRRDEPIDLITVIDQLRRTDDLDTVEEFYVVDLSQEVATAGNVQHHAAILVQKAVLRQLIAVLRSNMADAFLPGAEAFELLEKTEQEIFAITETQVRRPARLLKTLTKHVIENWIALRDRKADVTGVPSGFKDLDKLTGGWQKSDLIIIAARPSMGKCVDADTPIVLSDGRVERIADICARQQAELLSLGASGQFHVTSPSAYIDNGIKPVFAVRTALGRLVKTTLTHPFLTRRGWIPLSKLNAGEEIAVPRLLNVFGAQSAAPGAIRRLALAILKPQRVLRGMPAGNTLIKARAIQALPAWVFTLTRSDSARLIERVLQSGRTVRFGAAPAARQFAHLLLRFGILARVLDGGPDHCVHVRDAGWRRRLREAPDETESHILFDAIESIAYVGERAVYDLTIDGSHNFVAADVCVHNTALALNCARNAAMNPMNPTPCAIFSLEMTAQQLVQRLLTAEAEVDAQKARVGRVSNVEFQNLLSAKDKMVAAPIFIDDTPALGVLELRAKCRRMKAEHDIGLVILDYLQLMHGNNPKNREQEIAHISRSLKALAKELDVPVLALSQLNRMPETRGKNDKRPQLSDLRESGSIEQDADVVAFIYRPEMYGIGEDADGVDTRGLAEVIIGKHRNGPVGTVKLYFEKTYAKFKSKVFEGVHPPEPEEESPF